MINLRLNKMNRTLVKRGNKVSIQCEHEFVHYKINLNNLIITEFNYNHDPDIINGFDIINALANTTVVNDGESRVDMWTVWDHVLSIIIIIFYYWRK
jgi:hypothetical protein